ncbi:MAG: hypothetical protein FJ265_17175 [Planctomycetes bacterium]|nr:hypothetical protein [Planctomycetota bacterium]
MRFRRTALALALTLPLAAAAAQTPNTLLVIADDVGVDGVGCYGLGTAPPPTPNLDALAARGVRFLNAQVCPLCSPTRASALTGRHAFRTGVGTALGGNQPGLAASEVLLPEILAPAGIATALIGKWHLGDDLGALTPTAEGFGEFTGGLQGAITDYFLWPKVENGQTTMSTTYSTTDLVDEALGFVARTPGPWCLVLSFHAGHTPIHAPPANLHTQNLTGLDPQTTPIPFYKAMVQAMDSELGRLFAGLPAATLANTNVLFLGDNGTASLVVEPPFVPARSKGTIYQGGVRVPLIAAGPAVGGGPRVESGLVHAVDLFATLAALHGVDARGSVPAAVPLDAVSFVPLLQAAGRPPVREFAYSEVFAGATAMGTAGDDELIRDAQYALLRTRTGSGVREELYDLLADPWQTTDLLLQPLSAAAEDGYRRLWRALATLRGYPSAIAFGAGCSGAGLSPVLRAVTPPAIGTTFTMRVHGLSAAASATFGVVGFAADQWLGAPLPQDLGALGMPNCTLLLAPAITRFLVRINTVAPWNEALPNDPGLVGTGFFAQSFVLAPGANPAGALATRALDVVVGS